MTLLLAVALAGVLMINIDKASAGGSAAGQVTTGAAAQGVDGGQHAQRNSGMLGAMIKMVGALVVVILLVYLGLYLLRRIMGKPHGSSRGGDVLEVLQTTYVGSHKAVSLVKVANRSVLVGVTDSGISVLTELDADETEEVVAAIAGTGDRERFSRVLRTAADKIKEIGTRKKQTVLET